jgi:hypothetical protein
METAMPAPSLPDPQRQIIEFGERPQDFEPRQVGAVVPFANALALPFPAGLEPIPQPLASEPKTDDPMPEADILVVTWTVAELEALADVLTPGINRDNWYRYDRKFQSDYVPLIRNGAPALRTRRLASYFPTLIGGKKILCVKSELHLNQDGKPTGTGTATLPVRNLFRQMIDEVRPSLVITVGTAGATFPPKGTVSVGGMNCPAHELGDVMITRGARFRLSREFRNEPFANASFKCDTFEIPTERLVVSRQLLDKHAEKLTEPDFGPPTTKYDMPELVQGFRNQPDFRIDGRDFPAFHPILTTDFFEFGTSTNKLEQQGCGVEMGDAVLGLVVQDMKEAGVANVPNWLVIRNASDPQINGALPNNTNEEVPAQMRRALDMQAHWAVWYYESYGYWTSVNSAIAVWAMSV